MLISIALFVYVVLSWVLAAGFVDRRNPLPYQIYDFLGNVIEPMARPIRRIIPAYQGIDFSVLFLILIVHFARVRGIPELARALGVY